MEAESMGQKVQNFALSASLHPSCKSTIICKILKSGASSSTYVFCMKGIKEKVSIQGGPLPACLNLRGISRLRSLSYFDLSFPGYFDTHLTYLGSRNWRILCKKYPASLLTKEARLGCYNFFFLFTRRRQTKTLWQHLYNFHNFLLAFVYFSTSFILLKF